jgi:hypothetical protein
VPGVTDRDKLKLKLTATAAAWPTGMAPADGWDARRREDLNMLTLTD